MLLLGSSDCGGILQAIFRWTGHLLEGGALCFALLVATTFVNQSNNILLRAWALNNVAQNDMEIPCREEQVTQVEQHLSKRRRILDIYGVALLAILPMQ